MNRFFPLLQKFTRIIILSLIISCDDYVKLPFTGGIYISDISTSKATVKSLIVWDGSSDIKEYGFCWNTAGNPTKDDFFIEANDIDDRYFFTAILENLTEGTLYYVRSYAVNKVGIFYGKEKSFTTEAYTLPLIYSPHITNVTHNSVNCDNGRIISDNTFNILSKGICWSTSVNPTINDHKVELGSGWGGIGCKIEGLETSTIYYFRAYATNVVGTAYGGNLVAKTFDGYMTDYEGHVYSSVRLGNQEWMNRNLETRYFSNGERINTTGTPAMNIELENEPVFQWAFSGHEDHPELLDDDGRLYTWFAATDSRKICPAGWHLPTLDDWNSLRTHLGGDNLTSRDLRKCFNFHWNNPDNTAGTEGSFWAQLAGFRNASGQFQYGSNYGTYWWSATEVSPGYANTIYCGPADFDKINVAERNKKDGYSVRCVKDF